MIFPQTREQLISNGYVFDNFATCKTCGSDIEWYKTPKGKMMPVLFMGNNSSEVEIHFSFNCDGDL